MTAETVLETARLALRRAAAGDDAFILRLLNEPSFLQFIGDRGVRTLDDARRYIDTRLVASYDKNGFGLWVVERKAVAGAIGICGLVKRDTLPDPDIGFAFLPEHWRNGYALESAAAVFEFARSRLRLPRVMAIVNPENAASIRVVEKLGLTLERQGPLVEGERPVRVYSS